MILLSRKTAVLLDAHLSPPPRDKGTIQSPRVSFKSWHCCTLTKQFCGNLRIKLRNKGNQMAQHLQKGLHFAAGRQSTLLLRPCPSCLVLKLEGLSAFKHLLNSLQVVCSGILCWEDLLDAVSAMLHKGRHEKRGKLMLSPVARGWFNFENFKTLHHFSC